MGGMPGTIAKGQFFTQIDAVLNAGGAGKLKYRNAVLAELEQNLPLEEILERYATMEPLAAPATLIPASYQHLRQHWFRDANRWWNKKNTEAIIRAGLRHAIQLAGDHLPIETLWMCTGEQVEVLTSASAAQITVIILTPALPGGYTELDRQRTWKQEHKVWATMDGPRARDTQDASKAKPGTRLAAGELATVATLELLDTTDN